MSRSQVKVSPARITGSRTAQIPGQSLARAGRISYVTAAAVPVSLIEWLTSVTVSVRHVMLALGDRLQCRGAQE
ncbi:hypothetical protein GCM10023346_14500 [Arthrobacter gyeryongensis]|uniref:Uncharacterized protein n=1 Tax=Arthrobacter gyeryongensis TaxID=1650592 RepID=A0ABP9S9B0_9MICC